MHVLVRHPSTQTMMFFSAEMAARSAQAQEPLRSLPLVEGIRPGLLQGPPRHGTPLHGQQA